MFSGTTRRMTCLLLILSQLGCRSVYRFRCTSDLCEAGVVIAEEMVGETPCDVEIPKDSEWIQDGKVEFRFCLPDGLEKTKIVDLSGFTPSNPLAEVVAAPFFLVGFGAFLVASDDDEEDDEDSAGDRDEDEDKDNDLATGLAGLGVAGIGVGLYHLCGGKSEGMEVHEVHVDFNEPVNQQEPQTPSSAVNDCH